MAYKKTGPTALTTTLTTNIHTGAGGSAVVTDRIKHIHVANKTASAATFTIYLGAINANSAGTELFYQHSVAANSEYDWYGDLPVANAEYLVGGASANTTLTITIEYEREAV